MAEQPQLAMTRYFATVDDPRVERAKAHHLIDSIVIAVCAVICGADGWVDVAAFGRSKPAWLATFLALPNGIPSHATFGRSCARIDPEPFQRSLLAWVQAIQRARPDVIALDGTTHRRSHDRPKGKAALHRVSAWAAEHRLAPGQIAVDDKSNEITAIPQLLDLLDLRGRMVTIDARGTQTTLAKRIIQQGGQYGLALKEHQPTMAAGAPTLFADARTARQPAYGVQTNRTATRNHGRMETRQAYVIHDPAALAYLNERQQRAQVSGVVFVEAERTRNGVTTIEQRSYLLSHAWDAATVTTLVQGHWGIENQAPCALDVTFHEDARCIRSGDAPQNMGVLRHIALNLIRQESSKGSVRTKRFRAALDDTYLAKVLEI